MNIPSNISYNPPMQTTLEGGAPTKKKEFTRKCFGEIEWARQFGSVGEVPPLPDDIEEILDGPCPFFKTKKVFQTHLLGLIPAAINQEPLTLDKLRELIKKPHRGNPTKYRHYGGSIKKEHGSTVPDKTHWVLMTKDVIPGSRSKSYSEQKELVAQYPHYRLPKAREAVICIALEYIFSKRWIYGRDPLTYTRCQETVSGGNSVIVGDFGSGGLSLDNYFYYDREYWGVGPLREF